MSISRRTFLESTAALTTVVAAGRRLPARETDSPPRVEALRDEVGITTSSFSGHLANQSVPGKFTLLELPRILRDELDMRVIDLNTSSIASDNRGYLEKVRQAADDAGCLLTNLKLNQRGLDMNSAADDVRQKALSEYKRSIDTAALLGLRWARPLPLPERPDMRLHVASYRELADYAAERNIQMLVENYGWMQSDPDSVAQLVRAVGRNIAACPDTGNWSDEQVRYDGLAKTFPLAVTCDFKARQLDPEGQHEAYDLKRCFAIGWQAGFRGPWCLEHANPNRDVLFRELALLRDMLRKWTREMK